MGRNPISPPFSEICNFLPMGPQNTCILGRNTLNTRQQRHIICEVCRKKVTQIAYGLHAIQLHPLIDGHQCQLHNECRDPMNNNKDCWVEQLTRGWGGWRVVTEAEGGLRGLRGAEGGSGVRGVRNLVTFQKIKGWMGPLMVYMACISVSKWSRFSCGQTNGLAHGRRYSMRSPRT